MNEFSVTKNYNWQTGSELLVKKYVAELSQTGVNAPIATELFNNTDVAFTYDYVSPGLYAIIASKDIFSGTTGQKVQLNISNASYIDPAATTQWSIIVVPVFSNGIFIITSDTTALADSLLGSSAQNTIEITVYP
jgi:hypothetical protein